MQTPWPPLKCRSVCKKWLTGRLAMVCWRPACSSACQILASPSMLSKGSRFALTDPEKTTGSCKYRFKADLQLCQYQLEICRMTTVWWNAERRWFARACPSATWIFMMINESPYEYGGRSWQYSLWSTLSSMTCKILYTNSLPALVEIELYLRHKRKPAPEVK